MSGKSGWARRRRAPAAIAAAIGCSDAASTAPAYLSNSNSSRPGAGDQVGQRHPSGGYRAGLVEDYGVDPAGVLQGLWALDQDAELRAAAGADEDRGRGGQAHRARAGDDQYRHRGGERGRGGPAGGQPADQRHGGDREHDGNEHGGDAVREALHLCLARLRLGDQPRHLGELGLRADPGGADDEPPADVDAPAGHAVARPGLDRHWLARQHGRVNRGVPGDDDAVGRDLLSWPDHELVAGHECAGGDGYLAAVAEQRRLLSAQVEQRLQRGARPAPRPQFE